MKTTVRGLVVFFFMLFVAYGIAPKAQCDSLPTAQLQITGGSAGTEIAGGYALDLSAPGFSAIEPETFDATYPPGGWLPTDGSTISSGGWFPVAMNEMYINVCAPGQPGLGSNSYGSFDGINADCLSGSFSYSYTATITQVTSSGVGSDGYTAYQFEASGPFTASGNIEGIGLGGYPSCNEYITEPCQELWDVNFTGQGTVYLDGGFTQTPDGLAGGAVDGLSLTFEPTPELATLPLVFTGLAVLFMLGERNRLRRLPGAEK